MHTNLFFRLVEMFHNIVDRISNALLYFRDTYFYNETKPKKITTALILPVSLSSSKY